MHALGAVGAVPAGLGIVVGGEIPYLPAALEKRCMRALGFHAKFAIYPSQVSVIHQAIGVGAVAGGLNRVWALRAVEAYERAGRDGQGGVTLDGPMIDEATMKRVREVLTS